MELEADQIAKAKFGGLKPKPRLIVKVNCASCSATAVVVQQQASALSSVCCQQLSGLSGNCCSSTYSSTACLHTHPCVLTSD
jgi:hypothetical protein